MSRIPEKEKKNPILSFITKWVAEPLDNFQYAIYKVLDTMGVRDALEIMTTKAFELPFFNTLFSQLYDYEVFNHEVIPKQGPALICAQHQSLLDPITMGLSVVKHTNRVPYHFAKADLWADPYLNMFSRMNRAIFVRRGDSDQLAIQECIKKLEEGEIVIVYPEGTIGAGNGKLLEFKRGITQIAHHTNLPVIPAATFGIDKIYGKGMKFPKTKGIIKIKYGKPIPPKRLFRYSDKKTGIPDFRKSVKMLQRAVKKLWTSMWIKYQKEETKNEDF